MRDVRARGDLGDRERGEALLGDDFGGRVEDPFALAARDDLAREVVAAAGEPHLRAARALGGEAAGAGAIGPGAGGRDVEPGGQLGRVGGHPGDQFIGDLAQVAGGAMVQARDGHLADAAEQRLHDEIGRERLVRLAAGLDRALERVDRQFAAVERLRPGAEGAEQEQRHRVRLGGGEVREGVHGGAQAHVQGALAIEG